MELQYIDQVSHETIRRLLKNEIKPWRHRCWVIPPEQNADFVAAMEHVLDIYKRHYYPDYSVVFMDETPRQLIRETRLPRPARPGRLGRYDFEYERCGVYNVFLASEPLAGRRWVRITGYKTRSDWAGFIRELAGHYPTANEILLVMDNFKSHKPGSLYQAFPPGEAKRLWDRFEFVYTPRHGSWLNMAKMS